MIGLRIKACYQNGINQDLVRRSTQIATLLGLTSDRYVADALCLSWTSTRCQPDKCHNPGRFGTQEHYTQVATLLRPTSDRYPADAVRVSRISTRCHP